METATRPDSSVSFENFTLNLLTRELYRNGRRLKVHGHPLDVLAILIEHPGELVTRETLQKRIWPDNTFVDFEQSLNNSVGKLRGALGDRAEKPRFIETLPRLGYRFVAHVQNDSSEQELQNIRGREDVNIVPRPEASVSSPPNARWRKRLIIAAVSFLLFSLAISAYLINRRYARPPSVFHRIVVLPLVNTSVDAKDDSFADGMTERLITELSQFNAWEVISRTSAMHYKGSKESLPKIAHELSADLVVEGTVQRSGDQVRITAQLIDASRDVHLWSGAFQHDMTDVLALQTEIARAIADRTNLALTPKERARIQSPQKVVPQAYDAFLTGKFLYELERFQEAADYFEKATIADPNFTLAFAYLAESDGTFNFNAGRLPSERGMRAGDRAIQMDPYLAESRLQMGDRKFFRNWDWAGAEAEYRKAVELDPHSESALMHLGACLNALGRWDESIAVFKGALRVDPFSPTLKRRLLNALTRAHRTEEALVLLDEVIKISPDTAGGYYWSLGLMYEDMKRDSNAAEAYLRAESLSNQPAARSKLLQRAIKTGGIHGYWLKLYEFQQVWDATRITPIRRAIICAHAGKNDEAMQLLEGLYRQRNVGLTWLYGNDGLGPLRSDPRFQDLLRRMNFPNSPSKSSGPGVMQP